MDISSALEKIISRENLSIEQTRDLFLSIMSGDATAAQISAILIALRVKGECPEELAGAALVMRELSTKVEGNLPNLIDTCGTGGSGSKLFNISTASTFVGAGAGAHIAKHGNRKLTSSSGSADVLEAAGTKWNFLPFRPGLVGGHCISVDPYYLTHKAEQVGYSPQVVLAGRRINDSMGNWIIQQMVLKKLFLDLCLLEKQHVCLCMELIGLVQTHFWT